MQLTIPDFAMVTLIGASGSGKTTFASRHFLETEVVSSDRCRALLADDETDQSVTAEAFDLLYTIASKRLSARRLTVVDATNLRPADRAKGVEVAKRYHALPVAIVFDIPAETAVERNKQRPDRSFGARVVYEHVRLLRKSIKGLRREGYRVVHVLDSLEAVDAFTVVREPLYNDRRGEHGPFDVIGDVHGCIDELRALLGNLGYEASSGDARDGRPVWSHPQGRRAVFVGDLVDRGPGVVAVLRVVMDMVATGNALCVPGNHENKLARKLSGRPVTVSHGLEQTLEQIAELPDDERAAFERQVLAFVDGLVSHYWLDGGRLAVAHAGLRESMIGRGSAEVRSFALYGETTGETDEFGLPVRYNWAAEYRGPTKVVYGHTPVPAPEWVNNTVCVDTGCVYGGSLTALRYPELSFASVRALRTYVDPVRPLAVEIEAPLSAQQLADDLLPLSEVAGKRRIETRFGKAITIPEENAAAALEIASRFCADPRWLIYLPPTMSPSETSARETLLEHPDEAFAYYRKSGVARVVLEEKHMGSRAVVVLSRSEEAARRRFGVESGRGVVLTRTGRAFFTGDQHPFGNELLARLDAAASAAGLWERFDSDWLCLDAEIMPWSAKAQALVDAQYAPVGEAANAGLKAARAALATAFERGVDDSGLLTKMHQRSDAAAKYVTAYRHYVRPVSSLANVSLAPFHLLATEGRVHSDRDHAWHMEVLAQMCAADPQLLRATQYRTVALDDENAVADAIAWWTALTSDGGEGIVMKPFDFLTRGERGIVQPALKVRGAEYLRVVYGPEYAFPQHLERLRKRNIAGKRRLALAEFSLGLEALHRFVERAPLRAMHECVFGVLALESEPIDPRL